MNRNVALDLDFVRAQFPAFQDPRLGQWAFFENAGGSYVPETVIDRLSRFLVEKKVQPYAPFEASAEAGVDIDRAERDMAEMINAEPGEIVIGASTTMNIYVLANAMRPPLTLRIPSHAGVEIASNDWPTPGRNPVGS